MRFAARIDVTHLPGVLDPQGATVEVSIAKTIRLVLDAESEAGARAQVEEMCQRILANPVIERYTVEVDEVVPAS